MARAGLGFVLAIPMTHRVSFPPPTSLAADTDSHSPSSALRFTMLSVSLTVCPPQAAARRRAESSTASEISTPINPGTPLEGCNGVRAVAAGEIEHSFAPQIPSESENSIYLDVFSEGSEVGLSPTRILFWVDHIRGFAMSSGCHTFPVRRNCPAWHIDLSEPARLCRYRLSGEY
jgi:hypothetical protein